MKWINVENEMPEPQNQILILICGKVASIAKFNGFCFTEDGLDVDDVTHWCYIPEIPKSKQESILKKSCGKSGLNKDL